MSKVNPAQRVQPVKPLEVLELLKDVNPKAAARYYKLIDRFGQVLGAAIDYDMKTVKPSPKLYKLLTQLEEVLDNLAVRTMPAEGGVVSRARASGFKGVGIVRDKNGMPKVDNPEAFKAEFPDVWDQFTPAEKAFLGE